MKTGDRIKLFADTDRQAYVDLIHNMGFKCKVYANSIVVLGKSRYSDEDRMRIAKIINRAMRKKKISRAELAEKLQCHEETVLFWQRGRGIPCKYNLKLLSEILDVNFDAED